MIVYFIKIIILFGIFYIAFLGWLKPTKSFNWNRFYLIFSSLLAVFLPWLEMPIMRLGKSIQTSENLGAVFNKINTFAESMQANEMHYGKILFAVYAVGLLWGLLRFILGLIVLHRIKLSSSIEKIHEQNIYFNENIETPFSYNKNIFIPIQYKDKEILDAIILHEKAHIVHHHTRDKIYFSILQAVFWFNPFVYIYHKEIELMYEFEADEFSASTIGKDIYIENIVKVISYNQTPTILVHPFFNHSLKDRIAMLSKQSKNIIIQKLMIISFTLFISILVLFLQSNV